VDFQKRATVFGTVAKEYERARPNYPDEAVAWLAAELRLGPESDVLDLAAGTGKLTRQIVKLGARVVAVEPDEPMRLALQRILPGTEALSGTAEAIPLPDASVDAVTCAQAFHWFSADDALREMWRVLRPEGGVGLIWNLRDESDPFQAELTTIVGESDRGWNVESFFLDAVARSDLFGAVAKQACTHEQLLPRSQLVERVASMSAVATLDEGARAAVYGRVEALARSAPDPLRIAYVTEAYAFRRLD
jgi:ubiquinone/menaquinone biosynthesis C-methylase UbiE